MNDIYQIESSKEKNSEADRNISFIDKTHEMK